MKKLLVVSDFLDPGRLGGASRVVSETLPFLAEEHDVVLLAGKWEGPGPDTLGGARCVWFDYDPRRERGWGGLGRMKERPIAAWLAADALAPDAIIYHQPLSARSLLQSNRLSAIPSLYCFHSPWPREFEVAQSGGGGIVGSVRRSIGYRARKAIEGKVLQQMNRMVTLSAYMRQEAESLYGATSLPPIRIIPGGVDLDRFRPVPDRAAPHALGWPVDGKVLLSIRRLIPRMGLGQLIAGFQEAALEGWTLVIGGSGPQEEELRRIAMPLGDRVRFLGFVPDEQLVAAYASADVSVVPTLDLEGFGLVVLESMACGTPVLVTPVGGMPEIVGRFGVEWMLTGSDVVSISSGLRRIARDEPWLQAEGKRARTFVESGFSWERMATAIQEELDLLVQE